MTATSAVAAALMASPDPFFVLRPVRGPHGQIVELRFAFANEAAARKFARPVAEVVGTELRELLPAVGDRDGLDALAEVIDSGAPASFAQAWPRGDGTEGSFRLTATPFAGGLAVCAQDLTDQRRAERALAELGDEHRLLARTADRDFQAELAAERALAESELHYRLVAENASDFVVRASMDGVITWVTASITAILGWPPEELVGRSEFDFAHPDEVAVLRETPARVAAGEPVSGRRRIRCADGSYRWVSRTWRQVTDPAGSVVARVAGFRDIQAEVDVEQALAESEERYRMVAENASDVVVLARPDGAIVWVSPAVTRAMGWTPDELVGTTVAELVHPDDLTAMATARTLVYSGHEIITPAGGFVMRLRTKAGDWRWMSERATPMLDESGVNRGVVASLRDVDDLVQARQDALADRLSLRATVDSLLDPHVVLTSVRDEAGRVVDFVYVDANPAACAYNLMTREDLVGARLLSLFPGHAGTSTLDAYREVVETGEPLVLDDIVYAHEILGADRRYDIRAARVGDGISLSWRDVTDRHLAAQLLAESEAQYRLLTENASDVVMRLSGGRSFEWVSDSVVDLLGWGPPDLLGHPIDEFIHADDVAQFRQVVAAAGPAGAASAEFRFRRADGTFQWVGCRTRSRMDDAGAPMSVVGAMVDITGRKSAEAKLAHSASHDPLTGLANRSMLVDEVDRALENGRRTGSTTALLMVDLDRFKAINDVLGHAVGDELLRTVAGRIVASVRSVDLVARLGGDEFVVLLADLDDPADALRLADRLVERSREPVLAGGAELYATASVGVAVAALGVEPAPRAVDLLREADTAMYAAKLGGRDRVAQFTDDLRRTVDDRMHLESELRHAVVRNELDVWYQPEIDLSDGTVCAGEALLRWHHPSGELRTAAQFIDAAQESGLILDIGAWVLARACADAAGWAADDPARRLVVRVNLSHLELSASALLATVDQALADSCLDPALLCVEITEATVLSDSATVKANLDGIRQRGVKVAIDEFGTGYGSLAYFRRSSIDVLKVDRSLVATIASDRGDRQLVAGFVALADRLDISVTAEGVETAGQESALVALGCARAQGFLYSPALPNAEWAVFVRTHA